MTFERKSRRDTTPGPGMSNIVSIKESYENVYNNSEISKLKNDVRGQFIIVDSGCPRSLMGSKELENLSWVDIKFKDIKTEHFRFGPSRVYSSNFKVKFPVRIEQHELEFEFYVIDGSVPILLGNDVLELLGANVDLASKLIKF